MEDTFMNAKSTAFTPRRDNADAYSPPVTAAYSNVSLREHPDFSKARITGVTLTQDDERQMRQSVGKVIEAGNHLLGYSRQELSRFCGIQSAQFSKIIKGESWMNIGSQGLWGFATGISPADVAKLSPIHADPTTCMCYFLSGHLHQLDNDEFELVSKLICRRFSVAYSAVNTLGIEAVPQTDSATWRSHYLKNKIDTVAKRLVELRLQLGFSQGTLAEILGVSTETVRHYESGGGKLSRGVFATYRLYATLNVNPIELTVGSMHHKLRYIQDQRLLTLRKIVSSIDYTRFADLKDFTLSVKKL
jgi:transcriptional regulator with XRE-family HTH domain